MNEETSIQTPAKNPHRGTKVAVGIIVAVLVFFGGRYTAMAPDEGHDSSLMAVTAGTDPKQWPDSVWKQVLTPKQYLVLRQGGTDEPYTGEYVDNHAKGIYVTADCGEPVFTSEEKYESGTGWPSFWAPINKDAVEFREDNSLGEKRIEVIGKKCGTHLGHVFDDGPAPTGKRFCINSTAIKFIPNDNHGEQEKTGGK